MKALFDLFPLLVFFGAYATVDIFFATAAMMVATNRKSTRLNSSH